MLDKYNMSIENNIYEISKAFAVRIVNLYNYLTDTKKEHVMSKQLLRSGTSIGANVFEGKQAQSRADFASKMSIALKESVRVLKKGGYMALVVGPNKVSGYDFDTPKYLRLIAERYGMHTELLLVDSIKKYGMLTMRNKTAGMIMVEHVIVMKK